MPSANLVTAHLLPGLSGADVAATSREPLPPLAKPAIVNQPLAVRKEFVGAPWRLSRYVVWSCAVSSCPAGSPKEWK